MTTKKHLTVASDAASRPNTVEPKNISEALNGSDRDVLAAMRKSLAALLDNGEIAGNSIASAYRELRELDRMIRALDAETAAEEAKRVDSDQRRSFNPQAI